jgi:hypothetical protein
MSFQPTDYKPNSHKYKAEQKASEEKRASQIASGVVKKRSEARKIADMFISDEASNLKSLLLTDIVIPRITQLICDGVQYACDVIFKGKRDNTASGSYRTSYTSYSSYSDNRTSRFANESPNTSRFDRDDIMFRTKTDAEAVLRQMEEVIGRYGFVRVADMYDMAGLPHPFTSNKFGWMSLRYAEVRRAGDGWIIKLPAATPID